MSLVHKMASGSVWTACTAGHLRTVPQWEKNDWINFKKVAEWAKWESRGWIIFSRTSVARSEWDSWKVERAVHAWTSLVDELN